MKRSGFSLLEICLVISLLALISYFGAQSFAVYDRLLVHQELDRLYLLFVMLARKALLENRVLELKLTEHKLAAGVIYGVMPALQGPPSTPHAIHRPISFKHDTVQFSPHGIISAGTVYLTDTKRRWQYALTCAVGNIAYIRRYRYHMNAWELLA